MTSYRTENLSGRMDLTTRPDEQIDRIKLVLDGKLESFRAKSMNSRNSIAAGQMINRAQTSWIMQMHSLQAPKLIARLQRECALAGVCIEVSAVAKRKITIRDQKDILAAVDHQILDALVKGGYLVNDDTGNLIIGPVICEPVERYLCGGRECLVLTFQRSNKPCRDSITERVQRCGWPESK